MKSHQKHLSGDSYARQSLISKNHLTGTPDRLIGIKLAPLIQRNKQNLPLNLLPPDKVDAVPTISPNLMIPKPYPPSGNVKNIQPPAQPKLQTHFDRAKLISKKGYLDSSLEVNPDDKDITILFPNNRNSNKAPKPRGNNIILTPISQDKSNLLKASDKISPQGPAKRRIRSVAPKNNDISFISDKPKEAKRKARDFVPELKIPEVNAELNRYSKSSNRDHVNTDRTHAKVRRSSTPKMLRKGSEPSKFSVNTHLPTKVKKVREGRVEEILVSPQKNRIKKQNNTYISEVDQSLSAESGHENLMYFNYTRDKNRGVNNSDFSLQDIGKNSIEPSKRFNTSFSIVQEDAYDKLNELTNRNRNARDDLLKIQESVIELQIQSSRKRKNHNLLTTKNSDRENKSPPHNSEFFEHSN